MNIRGVRIWSSGKHLAGFLALLLLTYPALCADKPKSAPAKAPAPKSSAPASKPAGGGGGATHSSGPTTASHGPTTASHGPTTASHSPTTASHSTSANTAGHPAAVATHPSTGAAGKTGAASTAPSNANGTSGKTFGKGASGPQGKGPVATNAGRGTPVAKGQTVVQTKSGASVTKRPDGKVAAFHDPKRGMEVHHSLSGNRQVVVERSDHSRIVADRGGHGYVQRPYMYHGHEYARRSYYYNGGYYNNYYGRYYYRGLWVNPYYPSYYYGPAYYGWVYNPWATPISYGWGWNVNPWYGYYGSYFTPYPVYASPSLWLTDYIIANSLASAYQARANAQAEAALNNPAPLTPEVKQLIADEVRQQVALENVESKTAGQSAEPDPASSSIQRALTDGKPHVFVAGHDLDVVDAGGSECAISEGDALQLAGRTAPDAQAANLSVLASKGGKECPKGDTVSVALTDLQDMQNHMRETIDQGMQELQKKQGQGGLPAVPAAAKAAPVESAMASSAPPPPPESEVAAQIKEQSKEADKAEKEVAADAGSGPGPNAGAPAAEPVSIEIGQTIDQVTTAMGTPTRIVNLGPKKIYVYKDMKITFKDGKVSDVQ